MLLNLVGGGIIPPAPPPAPPVPTALLAGSVCVRCCLEQLLSFSWKGQDRSLILSFFSQRRQKKKFKKTGCFIKRLPTYFVTVDM